MTTAHRPTYHPAVGSAHSGGLRFHAPRLLVHSRDVHVHSQLKVRRVGQASEEEVQGRNLRQELREKEDRHRITGEAQSRTAAAEEDEEERDRAQPPQPLLPAPPSPPQRETGKGEGRLEAVDVSHFDDADAVLSERDNNDDDDEDEDDSAGSNVSDDDEAELQRELANIRQQREEERKKQAAAAASDAASSTAALHSNPLLSSSAFSVKRRWDEDVVFKGQSRGADVTVKAAKRFINDSIRADFHRSFMHKYIR